MIIEAVNKLIVRLGRKGYKIDENISTVQLFIVLRFRFFQVLRGFLVKYRIKEVKGLLFLGKRVKLLFKQNITLGRSVVLGNNVTINALSTKGVVIGNNVTILDNTIIECTGVIRALGEGLIIGNNVGISQNCFIQVRGSVRIEDKVIFGPGVYVFSENHNIENPNAYITEQGESRKGVLIKKGVWVGSRATILDGVTIGEHCVIAAGSIVTKDIPPFSVVAGIPAKIIKSRK